MILADKGGMGKTLSILMALVKGRKPGDGACVVVVPPSLTYQWMEEIETHFDEVGHLLKHGVRQYANQYS